MFIIAKLIFQHYIPSSLEKGMLFFHDDGCSLYEFSTAFEPDEEYIQKHGYPVKPYIVHMGNPNIPKDTYILASPDQIGWWDEGDDSDELSDVTLSQLNSVLKEDDGWLLIECEDFELDDEESMYPVLKPVIFMDKITIRKYEKIFEEYQEEEEHIENQ